MTAFFTRQKPNLFILGAFLLVSLPGCLATRGWVTEQISPLQGRMSHVEGQVANLDGRLNETNARVDGIVDRLDHLRLERRFVLNLREGANFGVNSGSLSPESKTAIDGFLSDLQDIEGAIFLVAGHTDSSGSEAYNYELGQKRATNVERYLIAKGVDPLRVTVVSYGESVPIADNTTRAGRQQNRRVEILVYKEVISPMTDTATSRSESRRQEQEALSTRGR
jgi:peptidoglycan-associated lipoprotein